MAGECGDTIAAPLEPSDAKPNDMRYSPAECGGSRGAQAQGHFLGGPKAAKGGSSLSIATTTDPGEEERGTTGSFAEGRSSTAAERGCFRVKLHGGFEVVAFGSAPALAATEEKEENLGTTGSPADRCPTTERGETFEHSAAEGDGQRDGQCDGQRGSLGGKSAKGEPAEKDGGTIGGLAAGCMAKKDDSAIGPADAKGVAGEFEQRDFVEGCAANKSSGEQKEAAADQAFDTIAPSKYSVGATGGDTADSSPPQGRFAAWGRQFSGARYRTGKQEEVEMSEPSTISTFASTRAPSAGAASSSASNDNSQLKRGKDIGRFGEFQDDVWEEILGSFANTRKQKQARAQQAAGTSTTPKTPAPAAAGSQEPAASGSGKRRISAKSILSALGSIVPTLPSGATSRTRTFPEPPRGDRRPRLAWN